MRSFSEQLPLIAGGAFENELTDALADALEYVSAHGGKPKITAEMELSSQITKAGPMIKIGYRVTVNLERVSDDGTVQRLKLFERFAISLQLYEGFPCWRVTAKLRYRVANGSIVFFYDIEGLEELFIENRDWATAKIKETGLPVFI